MRSKNYKGRCTKKSLSKCKDIVKTYDKVQEVTAAMINADKHIITFQCNVPLDGIDDEYTTDFLCKKDDGEYCVRECTFRSRLLLPQTVKRLDVSRNYWLRRGITDWAIVVEKENDDEGQ